MTIIIISITVVISILAFRDQSLFSKLQFNPYQVFHRKEWYRLITHGFVHAGWWHLFLNMFVLYFFGQTVEAYLNQMEIQGIIKFPKLVYILFYFLSMVFASTISLFKHKNDIWYNAVGASGAVSAIVFFSIFFEPWEKLYLYGVIGIPGIILGILYIIYSHYKSKRGGDNVAHDAHLLGAVFGFVFPLFIDLGLIRHFITELLAL